MLYGNESNEPGNPSNLEEFLDILGNAPGSNLFRETGNANLSLGDGRHPESQAPVTPDGGQALQIFPGSSELDLSALSGQPRSALENVQEFLLKNPVSAEVEGITRGFEAIAWYRPFHLNLPYQDRWGVYVRVDMLLDLAVGFWDSEPRTSTEPAVFLDAIHTIWNALLTHEYFHFQTEIFALQTEQYNIGSDTHVYLDYQDKVYSPNWGTADCLEEALATAKEIKSIPDSDVKEFLGSLALNCPGGYKDYEMCKPPRFTDHLNLFYAQVAEGSLGAKARPHHPPRNRGLFSTDIVPIYLVLPVDNKGDDDVSTVFQRQQPKVTRQQFLKFAEEVGGFLRTRGGKEPDVLRRDGTRPISVKHMRDNDPAPDYLISQMSQAIGKNKRSIRDEASKL